MPVPLDVFVLGPLLWLPFAVYANNEVARLIDGIWERHLEANPSARTSQIPSNRIGLSDTAHGYNAIANLSHAVFLMCIVMMGYFLFKAGGSYEVHAPAGLEERLQKPLHDAGLVVTGSIIVLNALMLVRFAFEKYTFTVQGENLRSARRSVASAMQTRLDANLDELLLPNPADSQQPNPNRASRRTCMYGCGHPVAPGFQPNGDPLDTCCRACARAEGHPAAHDRECLMRGAE